MMDWNPWEDSNYSRNENDKVYLHTSKIKEITLSDEIDYDQLNESIQIRHAECSSA